MLRKSKKKITVRISRKMKNEMEKNIIASGYGLHGKSKWLSDAILSFNGMPNKLEFITEGEDIHQGLLELVEAFYLSEEINKTLRTLMINARKEAPLLKGVQSSIIRACVIAKLAGIKFMS